MSTHSTQLNNQNLTDQHQQAIAPIDFEWILNPKKNDLKNLPFSYIKSIVQRMNAHFQIHMDGNQIGKLRITRFRRHDGHQIVDTVSTGKAKQLFPTKLKFKWKYKNEQKMFNMNVIDVFIRSPKIRNELYETDQLQIRQSPVVLWLQTQLSECPSLSTIRFGRLNHRQEIYRTFKQELNDVEAMDWTCKRISQEFYAMLPETRPKKGARTRVKGVPCIFIPQFHVCQRYLEQYNNSNINLRF
jgi:hypothetical protein|tara:strand:+ start:19 stop:747 length:729 start_codon:yes stop_codon:yes gene_type:complete